MIVIILPTLTIIVRLADFSYYNIPNAHIYMYVI